MDPQDVPIYPISRAAELAGMHAQTLRQYDRLGLVVPSRTVGRGRRYSRRDVHRLREIQHLSQDEGINLAGIKRILALEDRLHRLENRVEELSEIAHTGHRVFAAGTRGDIVAVPRGKRPFRVRDRTALVVWTPPRD
ncbi:MAG: heat shock protein transcriptional repressor HspR [Cellulomonadaceae bacterium]